MKFLLREWREDDAESVARYADNPKIAANLRDAFPHPYTLEDARAYIAMCRAADPDCQLFRAIETGGEAVGSISLLLQEDVYRRSAELGCFLAEPYWGRGVMSAAIRQVCAEAFDRFDIVRIFAEAYAYNTGSRRALEKAGFHMEGILEQSVCKNGRMLDSCIYALIRQTV